MLLCLKILRLVNGVTMYFLTLVNDVRQEVLCKRLRKVLLENSAKT